MATSVSTHPTAQMLLSNLNANDTSFLARSIRDLDPRKTASFDLQSFNFQSKLWLVAAGVTFVAFTALAAGAFFYAGVFLPAYVPFAGIGALILAMPVANFVKNFLEYSKASNSQALKHQALQEYFEAENLQTPLQQQNNLAARGIAWHQIPNMANPSNLSKLNPILAQAKYLDDKMQKEVELKQKFTDQARGLVTAGFHLNRQEIYDLRNAALAIEDRALQTKVHAAFVNAVLRKSNYNGALEDIATVSDVAYSERVLGEALGDLAGVNTFITFKNRNIVPISYADVKRMSVAELGQRLLVAMP